jgi:hypothetical protein
MRIVEAILRDQATVLSVSSLVTDYYGTRTPQPADSHR